MATTRQGARWRGVVLLLAGAAALAGLARSAADGEKPAALPDDLRGVPADAFGFVSVRLGELWNSDTTRPLREQLAKEGPTSAEGMRRELGVTFGEMERLTIVFLAPEAVAGDEPPMVVAAARPYDRAKILAGLGADRKEEKAGRTYHVNDRGHAVHFLGDRAYVLAREKSMAELLARPAPRQEGRLTAALRLAAGKHAAVAGLNPEPLRRAAGDNLPPQLEAFKPLLKADQVTLTVDFDAGVRGELRLTFPTEKDAREAEPAARAGLALGRQALDQGIQELRKRVEGGEAEDVKFVEIIGRAAADLKDVRVRQQAAGVGVSAHVKVAPGDAAVLLDGAGIRIRDAAHRIQSANDLHMLAIATLNYTDSNGLRLPPRAVFSPDGKPLLSWRVAILPYLDQEALYREFHLDEPWDSEHNKKLLAKMPRVYARPGSPAGTTETHYLGFVGNDAFFEEKGQVRFPVEIKDGTSNTLMYVEAEKAVPWTRPEDLPYDPKKPLPKLGGYFRGGFNAALCDGSVRFVSKSVSEKTLRAAITRNAGDLLGDDW